MKQRRRSIKQKKRGKRRARFGANILGVIAITLAIGYTIVGLSYKDSFLPNTIIGGIEVGGMTVEEVQEKIQEGIERYQLVIEERNHREEIISGKEIGLYPVYDPSLAHILEEQNPLLWGVKWMNGESYEQNCMVSYNAEKLEALVLSLECLNPEQIIEPVNASLVWKEGEGLVIEPEEKGSEPVYERLLEEIEIAVSSLKTRISLDERGIYRETEITEKNPTLLDKKEQWEKYVSVKVTYQFGNRSEVVDGNAIINWLTEDENGKTQIERKKVEEYVKGLAKKYNTAYSTKKLVTSYGPTVKITQGNYGWMIDQKKEVEELIKIIETGEGGERKPVYLQTAASHDGPDYGDTYVEMNLTAQHLFYYKDGKLLVESDFVSGNEEKGWSTPAGAYELTYKQKDAILRGSNYKTPVTYWMPFNGNIGMHDGYWRSSFGGTIYKKNGSHGCVNLPSTSAKKIFENIEKGTPILCYHLSGTETGKVTNDTMGKTGSSVGKEQEPTVEQTAAVTVPEESVPAETIPSEPVPEETFPDEPSQIESDQMESNTVSEVGTVVQPVEPKASSEISERQGMAESPAIDAGETIIQIIDPIPLKLLPRIL